MLETLGAMAVLGSWAIGIERQKQNHIPKISYSSPLYPKKLKFENMQKQEWSVRVRLAREEDIPFMREMLYEAAYWSFERERPPLEQGLSRPDLVKLLQDWGRPGDRGVIAVLDDHTPIGAAWYRFWTAEDHSCGFVDERTPELGIGVQVKNRNQGIGTRLLQALLKHAYSQGIHHISLSAELSNHALHLYKKIGFKKVQLVDGAWTMTIDLKSWYVG